MFGIFPIHDNYRLKTSTIYPQWFELYYPNEQDENST